MNAHVRAAHLRSHPRSHRGRNPEECALVRRRLMAKGQRYMCVSARVCACLPRVANACIGRAHSVWIESFDFGLNISGVKSKKGPANGRYCRKTIQLKSADLLANGKIKRLDFRRKPAEHYVRKTKISQSKWKPLYTCISARVRACQRKVANAGIGIPARAAPQYTPKRLHHSQRVCVSARKLKNACTSHRQNTDRPHTPPTHLHPRPRPHQSRTRSSSALARLLRVSGCKWRT